MGLSWRIILRSFPASHFHYNRVNDLCNRLAIAVNAHMYNPDIPDAEIKAIKATLESYLEEELDSNNLVSNLLETVFIRTPSNN